MRRLKVQGRSLGVARDDTEGLEGRRHPKLDGAQFLRPEIVLLFAAAHVDPLDDEATEQEDTAENTVHNHLRNGRGTIRNVAPVGQSTVQFDLLYSADTGQSAMSGNKMQCSAYRLHFFSFKKRSKQCMHKINPRNSSFITIQLHPWYSNHLNHLNLICKWPIFFF